MPSSAKHFFHKNRSQASLSFHHPSDKRPPQASPTDSQSPLHSPAFPPYSATSATSATSSPREDYEDYRFNQPSRVDESRQSHFTVPTRSQSQRSPPSHYAEHPTIQLVSPSHADVAPAAVEVNPDSYYYPPSSAIAPKDDRKRRFFRLGLSTKEPTNNSGSVNAQVIGRSISVRRKPTAPQISTEIGSRPVQHRWSASIAAPASEEEDDGVRAGLDPSHLQPIPNLPGPPLPEKDSLSSPRPPTQQGFPVRGASLPGAGINTVIRQPLERQGSSNSPWENTVSSVQEYQSHSETYHHRPQSYLPSPSSATSTSSHPLLPRAPPDAFQSFQHEQTSRPSSRHSFGPPSPIQPVHVRDSLPYRVPLSQVYNESSMGPPAQQQPPRRGSNELPQANQPGVLNRESSYQSYTQGSQGPTQASGPPAQFGGQLGVHPPGTSYRAAPQPSPMAPQPSVDAGRSTSPSSRSYDDMLNMDVAQVVAKYYELRKPISLICDQFPRPFPALSLNIISRGQIP